MIYVLQNLMNYDSSKKLVLLEGHQYLQSRRLQFAHQAVLIALLVLRCSIVPFPVWGSNLFELTRPKKWLIETLFSESKTTRES